MARAFGLAHPEGAIVTNVAKGGPGDQAGIRVGDLMPPFVSTPMLNNQRFQAPVLLAQAGFFC